MSFPIRVMGALVVTYLLSRALLLIFGKSDRTAVSVLAAHVVSIVLIGVSVGLLRAYWSRFEWMAVLPYLGPQLLWLVIDMIRVPRRVRA